MFDIDKSELRRYENALINFEVAMHGVDPRETLEGTTFRIKESEGYKQDIYDKYHPRLMEGMPYSSTVLSAFNNNLVDYHQKSIIESLIESEDADQFETALESLYEGFDDEQAFNDIVSIIGERFDVLGLLFFLKDSERYLPIRSSIFDERFKLINIDADLAYNCSWEKYSDYVETIKAIQYELNANVNKDITLLDAHSFVWILEALAIYLDGRIVEHFKEGKGVVVDEDETIIKIKFSGEKEPKSYLKENVLNGEKVKFSPPLECTEKPLSEKALEVAKALLSLVANRRRTITYGDLSDMTESKPSPYFEMRGVLADINRCCEDLGLPYISAMVVNKTTGLPGEGFRNLCIDAFGYDESLSTEEIFGLELDKIGRCDTWDKLAARIGIEMPTPDRDVEPLPEEIAEEDIIYEGAKKTITVNSYERDQKAVRRCKDYYMKKDGKLVCQICGFDFGAFYGPEYSNTVHIHHIKPISEIGSTYVINPETDLIPVCPNCHEALHSGHGLDIEELKNKIRKMKES